MCYTFWAAKPDSCATGIIYIPSSGSTSCSLQGRPFWCNKRPLEQHRTGHSVLHIVGRQAPLLCPLKGGHTDAACA